MINIAGAFRTQFHTEHFTYGLKEKQIIAIEKTHETNIYKNLISSLQLSAQTLLWSIISIKCILCTDFRFYTECCHDVGVLIHSDTRLK